MGGRDYTRPQIYVQLSESSALEHMFASLSDVTRFQIIDFRRRQKYARERLRSILSILMYDMQKHCPMKKMKYCGVLGGVMVRRAWYSSYGVR